jgi:signal transduction histidine kinase
MDRLSDQGLPAVEDFLRSLFFGLDEEELVRLAQAARVRAFPAGEVICREGEPGDAFYVIVEGQVGVYKQVDDTEERWLNSLGPGEFFGELALVQEGTRNATVRTLEPTTVLEIGREPFLRVLGASPSLAVRILVQLGRRLVEADRRALAELREANEQLRLALERLERLDRTKTDFIQVSAHELRTPVAALLGYAQMMQDHPLVQKDEQLRALVQGIVDSTDRLHRIFNSILDLSRVIEGDVKIHPSPVSFPVVFQGIRDEFQEALEERNLTFEVKGLHDLPFCQADPVLIYKAFRHLVNNAIKYTPDGGRITVTGEEVEVPDLGRCVQIVVEDTGIGIAPEDLDLIFEKFYRVGEASLHSSGTTAFKGGGPGLGLAIARGVVLAHGGRIWAESPGYDEEACPGSRFIVQLPLRPLEGEAAVDGEE